MTCVEIKILRRVRAASSRRPPRHRRDACSMAWRCRFLAARRSQHSTAASSPRNDFVIIYAPDTLVDFHTGHDGVEAGLGEAGVLARHAALHVVRARDLAVEPARARPARRGRPAGGGGAGRRGAGAAARSRKPTNATICSFAFSGIASHCSGGEPATSKDRPSMVMAQGQWKPFAWTT